LSLPEQDIPLGSLIQLALMDDEEALHSRTLWSDSVLEAARGACQRGLDLFTIMFTLREEAKRRGVIRE
jgi:heterodisulfide reductase subunit C